MANSTPPPAPSAPTAPEDPETAALLAFEPVRRRCNRHDGWTPQRQRDFVVALVEHGNSERAAHAVGRTMSGAYKVRTSAGAEGFANAWDRAVALHLARNPRPVRKGRPARGEAILLESPAEDRQADDQLKAEIFENILVKYFAKLAAEREARLAGRVVAADFYVRQLTFIEVMLDFGGRGVAAHEFVETFRGLTPAGLAPVNVVATPMSVLLDSLRREFWAERGEPERPPLPPLGRHDGAISTGEPSPDEYLPERGGPNRKAHRRREDARAALRAEAQRAWEEKARAEAEAWREREREERP